MSAGGTVFVTGMQRSGTTLVDRLLDAHPAVSVMSQPFPLLFVELRREYLRAVGAVESTYALGPQFLEAAAAEPFDAFLERRVLSRGQLDAAFAAMDRYSGQYVRFSVEARADALRECPAVPFAAQLAHLYGALSPRPDAAWRGGKETLCEAFVPHLLRNDARVVLVLRDPRDIIASLNHGDGRRWGGSPKPTLFNVRQWRKSVALACAHADDPGLLVVRYEALVADPARELGRAAEFLGIEPFDPDVWRPVFEGRSERWPGNSSFAASNAVGRYRNVLPRDVASYVEACCLPELRVLGYDTTLSRADAAAAIRSYVDPYPIEREELRDYGRHPADANAELERHVLLDAADTDDRTDYFVFPRARRVLSGAWR